MGTVNIPVLALREGDGEAMLAGRRLSRFKRVGVCSVQIRFTLNTEARDDEGTTVLSKQMPCFQKSLLSIR